jgi:hypothetical protein
MSWFAVGAAVIAGVSYINSSNQAQAQAKQGEATNESNASQSIANMQAVEAQASAQEEAVRQANAQYLGKQRAAMADSGTGSLGSGSNYDVGVQSAYAAEIDALNTRYQGELKGSEYLQAAYNYQTGANVAGAQASQLASTMWVGAGTAALSSYASSYSRSRALQTKTPGTGTGAYGSPTGSLS